MIKNRRGSKAVYLLKTDLDRNLWIEKNGILIPKEKKKKENFKKYVIFYFLLLINSLQIKNAALPSPKYSGYS